MSDPVQAAVVGGDSATVTHGPGQVQIVMDVPLDNGDQPDGDQPDGDQPDAESNEATDALVGAAGAVVRGVGAILGAAWDRMKPDDRPPADPDSED